MATSLGTVVKKEKLQASTMSREGERGEIRWIREHSLVNKYQSGLCFPVVMKSIS